MTQLTGGGMTDAGSDDIEDPTRDANAFERFRLAYGREIVVIALVVVTAVVAIVVVAFEASTGAAAVLGAVTTLIGTLVGTFFGAQIASQGQDRDAASRERAQELAVKTAALLDPQVVREYGPMLFGTSAGSGPVIVRRTVAPGSTPGEPPPSPGTHTEPGE